jgi:hypothetical protein
VKNIKSTILLSTILAVSATVSNASVLAISNFDSGIENKGVEEWANGDFFDGGNTGIGYANPQGNGYVITSDNFDFNAFVAPRKFLGDKTAAIGGTISFEIGDDGEFDTGFDIPLIAIKRSDVFLYGGFVKLPDISNVNLGYLTKFVVRLDRDNFWSGSPRVAEKTQATSEQFSYVMSNIEQLTINADFKIFGIGDYDGNGDVTYLDDVILKSGISIPEPSTWAFMIGGFCMAGAMLRRRRKVVVA